LTWAEQTEVLAAVLDAAAVGGLPIFSNAVKVLEVAARRFKRWNTIRQDQTLQDLDELSVDELGDAVTFLFAGELDAHRRYLPCVDAYEARSMVWRARARQPWSMPGCGTFSGSSSMD
jgi:hypothetical protein